MRDALTLAASAINLSNPNPRVGCVIVGADGRVLGEGHTQAAGGPHAEVVALRQAQAGGNSLRGSTVYVTLEPCAHHGRTPPCCDALIAAGVTKVVLATIDPNPLVAGQGIQRMTAAGVEVLVLPASDPLAVESRELNIGFFSRMLRQRPWVRAKAAISLNGKTALANGQSQWITGEEARSDGHTWRARSCAVLTGVGTIREDDPRLDARVPGLSRQPHLVIVDSRLETPPTARVFDPSSSGLAREVWMFHASVAAEKAVPLAARGAVLTECPGPGGKVGLSAMLKTLADRGVNELHIEAGHALNGSLLREGLIDEWLIYQAPVLLGDDAMGLARWAGPPSLDNASRWRFLSAVAFGPDMRLIARAVGHDDFLKRTP